MLRAIDADLWVLDHPLTVGGLRLGTRMTVIRLADGGLWLHSPVPVTDAQRAEIDALGTVRFVVAPSLTHHLYAHNAMAHWPDARLYLAPGLVAKRPELREPVELSETPPEGWQGQLDQVVLAGMPRVNEVVFLHRPSRSLIVTDLLFNYQTSDHWFTRWFLGLDAALGGPRLTRIFRWNIQDRAAFRSSLDRVIAWEARRFIPCHGAVFEGATRPVLEPITASLA